MQAISTLSNEARVLQIQQGINARENITALWCDNISLIRWQITKITGYSPKSPDFEDMEQQAYLGFIDAVMLYDPERGNKFFTFAYYMLYRSIRRYYYNYGFTIRIPEFLLQSIRTYTKTEHLLLQQNGRKPTEKQIFKEMGLNEKQQQTIKKALQVFSVTSIYSEIKETNNKEALKLIETLAADDDTAAEVLTPIWHKELHNLLMQALKLVTPKQYRVIILHYFQGYSITRIAEKLNCQKQNVINLEQAAFTQIRCSKYNRLLMDFLE